MRLMHSLNCFFGIKEIKKEILHTVGYFRLDETGSGLLNPTLVCFHPQLHHICIRANSNLKLEEL